MNDLKEIVLITGAGSSNALHPQFALGVELLQQISDRVTDRTKVHEPYLSKLYKTLGFDYSTCWDFVHHLDEYHKNAGSPSIDEFLNEVSTYPEFKSIKTDFVQIGKFAIMFHILGYEGEIKKSGIREDAWINIVAKYIDKNKILEQSRADGYSLKIITFNYDRNIEHFLYNHKLFDSKKTEIKSYIDKSILHVYGKIGDLEWQNPSEYFEFGADNSKAEIIFNRKNAIDVMYDERSYKNSDNAIKAREWIHSVIPSKLVCAFGFNFDLINYRRLYLQNLGWPDAKLIANVYPHGDASFSNRRMMANKIRKIIHDAEVTYLNCSDFVDYIFKI